MVFWSVAFVVVEFVLPIIPDVSTGSAGVSVWVRQPASQPQLVDAPTRLHFVSISRFSGWRTEWSAQFLRDMFVTAALVGISGGSTHCPQSIIPVFVGWEVCAFVPFLTASAPFHSALNLFGVFLKGYSENLSRYFLRSNSGLHIVSSDLS